jgi:hypothetical protein
VTRSFSPRTLATVFTVKRSLVTDLFAALVRPRHRVQNREQRSHEPKMTRTLILRRRQETRASLGILATMVAHDYLY